MKYGFGYLMQGKGTGKNETWIVQLLLELVIYLTHIWELTRGKELVRCWEEYKCL